MKRYTLLVNLKTGIVFLLCVFYLKNPLSQTIIPNGSSVNGIWSLSGSPYIIHGNINISSLDVLTIEPNVEILFNGNFKLTVFGKLIAEGTQTGPIIFDVVDTTGFSMPSNVFPPQNCTWRGIEFLNNSNSQKLIHCFLKHANRNAIIISNCLDVQIENSDISSNIGDYSSTIHAAIKVEDSEVFIRHNNIHHNERLVGISMQNSSGIISFNDIHDNNTLNGGAGISCEDSSNPLIFSNDIHHNSSLYSAYGQSGGISIVNSSPELMSNSIYYNSSFSSGGGVSVSHSSNPIIISNLIANNILTAKEFCGWHDGGAGIYIHNSSLYMQNNIVVNNESGYRGSGVYSRASNLHCFNNLISNNKQNYPGGGAGLWIQEDDSSIIANTIIYGNEAYDSVGLALLLSPLSDIDFFETNGTPSHSIINCNISNYSPQFVNPSLGAGVNYDGFSADWHSYYVNSNIDGGTIVSSWASLYQADFDGMQRVQGVTIDIGPFENGDLVTVPKNDNNLFYNIYPNPTKAKLNVETEKSIESLMLYSIKGELILTKINEDNTIDLSGFSKGMYLLKVEFENGESVTKRVIKN